MFCAILACRASQTTCLCLRSQKNGCVEEHCCVTSVCGCKTFNRYSFSVLKTGAPTRRSGGGKNCSGGGKKCDGEGKIGQARGEIFIGKPCMSEKCQSYPFTTCS